MNLRPAACYFRYLTTGLLRSSTHRFHLVIVSQHGSVGMETFFVINVQAEHRYQRYTELVPNVVIKAPFKRDKPFRPYLLLNVVTEVYVKCPTAHICYILKEGS
ncbi:hypothetical protein IP70_16440 [alpha proteobacterium AAP38]|nr:hypothetical protein IP70_16440 [alpha proteobacterium AAP38]